MKLIKIMVFLSITVLSLVSFKPKYNQSKGYYAILVVDGSNTEGTGYASRIIYYPGYSDCKRYEGHQFFNEARRSFSDHLKAYHSSAFPNGANSNIKDIDTKQYSTSQLLTTRAQAEQRLTEWAAEQKDKGYKVVYTYFSFTCDNL